MNITSLGEARFPSPVPHTVSDQARIPAVIVRDPAAPKRDEVLFELAGPRAKLFFDPAKTRAGIVTCGGLCPGLNNVIRAFRIVTKKAGLGEDWVPREMRHTFVSVLSANGVPVESIALLAGHERTATTESVYRHEIRPALTQGAEVMDKIFG